MTFSSQAIEYSLTNNQSQVLLIAPGGQVVEWKAVNQDHEIISMIYRGSNLRRSGIPILFPFANPLKDGIFKPTGKEIGQHGFARDQIFDFTLDEPNQILSSITQNHLSASLREAFPYNFKLVQTISLPSTKIMKIKLSVINNSPLDMPIAPGLHPYFPIPHNRKSQLKIDGLTGFDASEIDWSQNLDGHFYDFNGRVVVHFPDDRSMEIVETSLIKEFKHLVIWSQTSQQPDCDFICIEPFTRQTNAINDNPILVQASGKWEASLEFRLLN